MVHQHSTYVRRLAHSHCRGHWFKSSIAHHPPDADRPADPCEYRPPSLNRLAQFRRHPVVCESGFVAVAAALPASGASVRRGGAIREWARVSDRGPKRTEAMGYPHNHVGYAPSPSTGPCSRGPASLVPRAAANVCAREDRHGGQPGTCRVACQRNPRLQIPYRGAGARSCSRKHPRRQACGTLPIRIRAVLQQGPRDIRASPPVSSRATLPKRYQ